MKFVNSQAGSIRFTVKTEPVVIVSGSGTKQVMFIGVTPEGEEINYLKTEGFEHYGPNIGDEKEYFTWDEIQNELNKSKTDSES